MCELFALSSLLPTEVSISLHRFAQRGGLNSRTLDGWGLALYSDHDLRLYREPEPARDSAWLDFIERRHQPSHCVISHIRQATAGAISLANTQPFVRELGGRRHCFAHNGRLADVGSALAPATARFHPIGETDSDFAAEMRALGPANFLFADGDALFAHGDRRTQADGSVASPGLWMLHRQCAVDPGELATSGVRLTGAANSQQLILFASVPLTAEDWRPLREGELVAVRQGRALT